MSSSQTQKCTTQQPLALLHASSPAVVNKRAKGNQTFKKARKKKYANIMAEKGGKGEPDKARTKTSVKQSEVAHEKRKRAKSVEGSQAKKTTSDASD